MHQFAGLLLVAVLASCTSTNSTGPIIPGEQTGTNCPAGSPWYWCTGYREKGR